MRTSYKKNRPFDFKLIDLVEPNPVLYQRYTGLSNYETMKAKNLIWDKIARLMNCNVEFCLMRWNNLRYQFQKELRRAEKLCPKLGVTNTSTWPYLERLRFLTDIQQLQSQPKSKINRISRTNNQNIEVLPLATTKTTENPEIISPEDEIWQSYNDCVVMHVTSTESQANPIIINEMKPHEMILEDDIIEGPSEPDESVFEQCEYESKNPQTTTTNLLLSLPTCSSSSMGLSEYGGNSVQNFLKMNEILTELKGENRQRAERRIMGFLLKCQLRVLLNEPIDDLVI